MQQRLVAADCEAAAAAAARDAVELAARSFRRDGDAALETPEVVRVRRALQQEPEVQRWLGRFYGCFASARRHGHVGKAEYIVFQCRVARVLLPAAEFGSEEAARRAAEEDWQRDTAHDLRCSAGSQRSGCRSVAGRRQAMRKSEFFDSLFELTDTWTETVDAGEYVAFLSTLFDRLTVRRTDGRAGWRLAGAGGGGGAAAAADARRERRAQLAAEAERQQQQQQQQQRQRECALQKREAEEAEAARRLRDRAEPGQQQQQQQQQRQQQQPRQQRQQQTKAERRKRRAAARAAAVERRKERAAHAAAEAAVAAERAAAPPPEKMRPRTPLLFSSFLPR